MTPELLKAFGEKVRAARIRESWTLATLAKRALGKEERKGYMSHVELGKRRLSPLTIGKIAHALDLPNAVTAPLLRSAPEEDEFDTQADQDVERLLRLKAKDALAPPAPDDLLTLLAYEFAGGRYKDHFTAYQALRDALQAAADLSARGKLSPNTNTALQSVMREVSDLNAAGLVDTAADALAEAMKRAEAEQEAIHGLQLEQDRVRNDAAGAAARIEKRLRQGDLPKGLFWAVFDEGRVWRIRGSAEGKAFDLRVALDLARINAARGKGREKGVAYRELGYCQFAIGERSGNPGHLRVAESAMRKALRLSPRLKIASDWARSQGGLGMVLWMIGERDKDAARLREAVTALKAALEVFSPSNDPENWTAAQDTLGTTLKTLSEVTGVADHLPRAIAAYEAALTVESPDKDAREWAASQNNLGTAQLRLGAMTGDAAALDAAAVAFRRCRTVWTRETAPFLWATTQWNLADLALERYRLSPDPALLATARAHLSDAREIFEDGSDHQLERCDELAARIDAAEAA